jgi:hypothetical protein
MLAEIRSLCVGAACAPGAGPCERPSSSSPSSSASFSRAAQEEEVKSRATLVARATRARTVDRARPRALRAGGRRARRTTHAAVPARTRAGRNLGPVQRRRRRAASAMAPRVATRRASSNACAPIARAARAAGRGGRPVGEHVLGRANPDLATKMPIVSRRKDELGQLPASVNDVGLVNPESEGQTKTRGRPSQGTSRFEADADGQ